MSLVVKAALFCDGCGERVDLDPAKALDMKFGPIALKGTALEGWREVRQAKHLCPECAADYAEMERDFQRQLDEKLGIGRVEFDLR